MNVPFYIARRYLFSKKKSNAINIITWVSIVGIGVGTGALIMVLSVFNGLTGFIEDLFSAIDPDIKVVAARGQTFTHDEAIYEQLLAHKEVAAGTRTIEGRVWLEYVDNQTFGVLKGVEPSFINVNPLDTFIYEGNYTFAPLKGITRGVVGSIVAANLSANLSDETRPISLSYIPRESNMLNPQNAINTGYLLPSGYFSIQKEYDEKYIVTDFAYVQDLFDLQGEISAYELRLHDIDKADRVRDDLQAMLGADFEVMTWYEQHATLYRVMKNEKYISYLILVLMLAIAAVNIVGSLYMIVLEKVRDIAVLKSMGASSRLIRRIFLADGLLVGAFGGLIGVSLALAGGLAQKYFGLIKLNGGASFRVKAFPIALEANDFILVFLTVMVLAVVASLYPSVQAAKVEVVKGLRQ
jgi:lipoprotein-releasing system permease protein